MAGTWKALDNQPTFNASTMLLLTDGTVMCQQSGGVNWYKLTPDAFGDYSKGTWSTLAAMINTRLYYASAVLRDGRAIVCGGEYSNAGVAGGSSQQNETNRCEIYDPLTDTWTAVTPPGGWTNMGDAACALLPDGRLLVGYYNGTKTALYDPTTGNWSAGPNKGDSGSEETWTLLPDETVLAVQCSNAPFSEKYVAAANQWVTAGRLPVNLVEAASIEIGPACLMPDGRVFCVGATNKTAIYTPPVIASQPGTWVAGPDIPSVGGKTIGAKDAPACLMPNGKVLFVGGPVDGQRLSYLSPTYFYEFDGSSIYRVPDPPNAGGVPYQGRTMMLPSGQVLFAAGTHQIYCYTPDGSPDPVWRPSLTSVPSYILPSHTYTLQGRQINGLSQAVAYGDDAASATNYPIVRLRQVTTGRIYCCRTFDHSTMGVATGATVQNTNFHVPAGLPAGQYEICVVANGISSPCLMVTCQPVWWWPFHLPRLGVYETWNWLIGSLADGPLWVWGPHGPVPVDPRRAEYFKPAQAARKMMLDGMAELQKLGSKLVQARAKEANAVPPAEDLEAEEAGTTIKKALRKTKSKPQKAPANNKLPIRRGATLKVQKSY